MSFFVGQPVCLSLLTTLTSVKIQKWRPIDIFRRSSFFGITICKFLVLQIMHSGIIMLSEIVCCAVKWLKFTSEILIYVNLYLS